MQVQYAAPLTPGADDSDDEHGTVMARALRRHAVEFESILLGQVLEKLEHAYSCVPGEQPTDAGHDTEASLATQALATGIAKAGGFGFAKMILKYLPQPEAADSPADPAPDEQPADEADARNFAK